MLRLLLAEFMVFTCRSITGGRHGKTKLPSHYMVLLNVHLAVIPSTSGLNILEAKGQAK